MSDICKISYGYDINDSVDISNLIPNIYKIKSRYFEKDFLKDFIYGKKKLYLYNQGNDIPFTADEIDETLETFGEEQYYSEKMESKKTTEQINSIISKVKILYYIPWGFEYGCGPHSRMMQIINYLISKKFDIHLVISNSNDMLNKKTMEVLESLNVKYYISEMSSLLEQWDIINPDYCWINFLNSVRPDVLRLIKTRSKIICDIHDVYDIVPFYQRYSNNYLEEPKDFNTIRNDLSEIEKHYNKHVNIICNDPNIKFIDNLVHISKYDMSLYQKTEYYQTKQYLVEFINNPIEYIKNDETYPVIFASSNVYNKASYLYWHTYIFNKLNTKILVYGTICDFVKDYPHPNIIIKGKVDDVLEVYKNAKYVINITLFRTGTKTKINEAISYNTPVISFDFISSCGGSMLHNGINGIIVDNENDMIDKINKINNIEYYSVNCKIIHHDSNEIFYKTMLDIVPRKNRYDNILKEMTKQYNNIENIIELATDNKFKYLELLENMNVNYNKKNNESKINIVMIEKNDTLLKIVSNKLGDICNIFLLDENLSVDNPLYFSKYSCPILPNWLDEDIINELGWSRQIDNISYNWLKRTDWKNIFNTIMEKDILPDYLINKKEQIIPLEIHLMWHTKKLPTYMNLNVELIRKTNPEFNVNLYDDDDCREFILKYFDENVLEAFDKLIPGAFKSDLARLCILYIKGGVYMDIKLEPINGFKLISMVDKEYFVKENPLIFTDKLGIYNAFMITKPNNNKLYKCIMKILENVNTKYYGNLGSLLNGVLGSLLNGVLDITGPELMGKILEEYNLIFDGSYIYNSDYKILKTYNNYRKEQSIYSNILHYNILFNNKFIYWDKPKNGFYNIF